MCVVKEDSKNIPLYSIDTNPFRSYEFCVAGRGQHIRYVCFIIIREWVDYAFCI